MTDSVVGPSFGTEGIGGIGVGCFSMGKNSYSTTSQSHYAHVQPWVDRGPKNCETCVTICRNNALADNTSDTVIMGTDNSVSKDSSQLIIIGNNIHLDKDSPNKNVIYLGGDAKIYIKIREEFVDLAETLELLLYAPPGRGGALYNAAESSFNSAARGVEASTSIN